MTSTIRLIAAMAPDYGAMAEARSEGGVRLHIPLKRADGRVVDYVIVVTERGDGVSAREETPTNLPAFCPDRHINGDGSFCLFWQGDQDLGVVDMQGATTWWETLWKFLKHQERAKALRRWPTKDGWAHGDAARHQRRARVAAAAMSATLAGALDASQIQVVRHAARSSERGPTLRLYVDGVELFGVWEAHAKFVNRKRRCFCGVSGKRVARRVRACRDHAAQAVELAFALRDWQYAEEQFWAAAEGSECCGTCDGCRLSRGNGGKCGTPSATPL